MCSVACACSVQCAMCFRGDRCAVWGVQCAVYFGGDRCAVWRALAGSCPCPPQPVSHSLTPHRGKHPKTLSESGSLALPFFIPSPVFSPLKIIVKSKIKNKKVSHSLTPHRGKHPKTLSESGSPPLPFFIPSPVFYFKVLLGTSRYCEVLLGTSRYF